MYAQAKSRVQLRSGAHKMQMHAWSPQGVRGGACDEQTSACLLFLARELFISYMASLSEQCVGHSLAGGGTSRKGGRHCQPRLLVVFKGFAPSRPSLR